MRGFLERMTWEIQSAESGPDDRLQVMWGHILERKCITQTSLWVLLFPELSLNLSHNLSSAAIELFSDSKRSTTVIRERKQTGVPKGLRGSIGSCDSKNQFSVTETVLIWFHSSHYTYTHFQCNRCTVHQQQSVSYLSHYVLTIACNLSVLQQGATQEAVKQNGPWLYWITIKNGSISSDDVVYHVCLVCCTHDEKHYVNKWRLNITNPYWNNHSHVKMNYTY